MKKIDEQDKRNEAITERLDAMAAERLHPTWRAGIPDPMDGIQRRFDFSTPAEASGSGARNPSAPPMSRLLDEQTPAATRVNMTEPPPLCRNSRRRAGEEENNAIDVDAQQNNGTTNLQQTGSARRISQEELASALNGIRTDEVSNPTRGDNPNEEEKNLQWIEQVEPGKVRIPFYEGTTDLKAPITAFRIAMGRAFTKNAAKLTKREVDAGYCLLFVEHLKGAALEWFSRQERNSIGYFQQLSALFLKQYSMFMDRGTSDADLWTLSQGPNEPLRDYMARFKAVISKIEGISDRAALEALKRSLWYKSEFRREMALNTPQTIQDALHRSSDFVVNEEEMKNLDEQYEATKAAIRSSILSRPAKKGNPSSNASTQSSDEPRSGGAHNYRTRKRRAAQQHLGEKVRQLRQEGFL
ncbi:uncharacterized protein LOC112085372 [Eutrema salsugineum]|uniref:uncharacterized protein LOC112085372 n=1 Tax=Eutrema salsugineum TaxID=72664 RepID=UPI000CECEE9A|nr:uncharacterized protein LOC112085372 [Eutrema salsugineum]